jgi:uncharacterized protein YqjF (DUF2071 family)
MLTLLDPFLTARWEHLVLATYLVPPELLAPRLAPGLELDTREGRGVVSLVGFMFLDTKVARIGWPGYRDFPELNLRFYCRRGDERGVMFVREYVPHRLIAWIARYCYNEPYVAAPMTGSVDEAPAGVTAAYTVSYAGRVHRIAATGAREAVMPGADSLEHWIKEHSWGYGRDRAGRLVRYEVRHPHWAVHPVRSHEIDVDWASLYGAEWAVLAGTAPISVVLARGSAISVHRPETGQGPG